MKKFLNILMILTMMCCIVACGDKVINNQNENQNNSNNGISGEIVVEKKYCPEENLNQYAELQTISLPENPTTGYEWVYILGDAGKVNVQKDEFVSDSNS